MRRARPRGGRRAGSKCAEHVVDWYRIPDSWCTASCVSAAIRLYLQETHETQDAGSIRAPIRAPGLQLTADWPTQWRLTLGLTRNAPRSRRGSRLARLTDCDASDDEVGLVRVARCRPSCRCALRRAKQRCCGGSRSDRPWFCQRRTTCSVAVHARDRAHGAG
jgi:hypothetical protein